MDHYENLGNDYNSLSDYERNLYKELSIDFEDKGSNDATRHQNLREKLLFVTLKKKKGDHEIDKLVEITSKEIDMQFERIAHIENRSGFLVAIWGILLGVILRKEVIDSIIHIVIDNTHTALKIITIIFSIILVCSLLATAIFLGKVLWSGKMSRFRVEDKEENYVTALFDKELMQTVTLEYFTMIWEDNENVINQKGNNHNISLIIISISFLSIMVLSVLINYVSIGG